MPTTQTTRRDKTYVPNPDEIAQAKRLFDQLEDDLAETGKTLLTSPSGQIMELPPTLFDALRFVGANLASATASPSCRARPD